jgi:hypothetical protein
MAPIVHESAALTIAARPAIFAIAVMAWFNLPHDDRTKSRA